MLKILLVEDEETLREAYLEILATTGADVRSAKHGAEALERCELDSFDLVLLDLMMPVLDGVGFLRAANLPMVAPDTKVVVFSNVSSGGDVNEALELGAHRQVVKADLTPRDLLALVDECASKS
jgi:CheY-like chemotaxis protein